MAFQRRKKIDSMEQARDFARWLESTTWYTDTHLATVKVPPTVIKRSAETIRSLLDALEQKNKGKGA
jgi:hypothetical protein